MLRCILILFLSGILSGCHDAEKPETSYSDRESLLSQSFKVIGDTTCLNGEITEPKNYLCPICAVVFQSPDILKINDAKIEVRNRTNKAIVSFEIEFLCASQGGFSYQYFNLIYDESLNPGERKKIDAMIGNDGLHGSVGTPELYVTSKSVVRVEFEDGTVWKNKK